LKMKAHTNKMKTHMNRARGPPNAAYAWVPIRAHGNPHALKEAVSEPVVLEETAQ
jgi:hypothetical protein